MTDKVKELIKKVQKLRKEGKTYREVGEALGITRQYAEILDHYDFYHDEEHRKRHETYRDKSKQKEYSRTWRERHPEYYRNWYLSKKKAKKGDK